MKIKSLVASVILLSCLILLPLTASALEVGESTPLFTADSTSGEISLARYSGKKNVVLALYFAVFTSV